MRCHLGQIALAGPAIDQANDECPHDRTLHLIRSVCRTRRFQHGFAGQAKSCRRGRKIVSSRPAFAKRCRSKGQRFRPNYPGGVCHHEYNCSLSTIIAPSPPWRLAFQPADAGKRATKDRYVSDKGGYRLIRRKDERACGNKANKGRENHPALPRRRKTPSPASGPERMPRPPQFEDGTRPHNRKQPPSSWRFAAGEFQLRSSRDLWAVILRSRLARSCRTYSGSTRAAGSSGSQGGRASSSW